MSCFFYEFRCLISVIDFFFFFFQAEDGIRDAQESRGLGDVYKRQTYESLLADHYIYGVATPEKDHDPLERRACEPASPSTHPGWKNQQSRSSLSAPKIESLPPCLDPKTMSQLLSMSMEGMARVDVQTGEVLWTNSCFDRVGTQLGRGDACLGKKVLLQQLREHLIRGSDRSEGVVRLDGMDLRLRNRTRIVGVGARNVLLWTLILETLADRRHGSVAEEPEKLAPPFAYKRERAPPSQGPGDGQENQSGAPGSLRFCDPKLKVRVGSESVSYTHLTLPTKRIV
eukprot:TRINITY_DN56997_c0_g1_i1.p1 TRINITY_DN56997_c0_g1~~TRINITY_DN56997_c0_g1_i1.p1  ORF type:complete len:285 (+),score=62.36 TRINITY_DN56997_c0_g1_i1:8-862(+)